MTFLREPGKDSSGSITEGVFDSSSEKKKITTSLSLRYIGSAHVQLISEFEEEPIAPDLNITAA